MKYEFYEQLKKNKITKLNLNNKEIKNIDELAESLKYNYSLTYLNLSGNEIENIDKLAS